MYLKASILLLVTAWLGLPPGYVLPSAWRNWSGPRFEV